MPKARSKGTVTSALDGAVFCISGTMSVSRAQLTAEIKHAGGAVASSVTAKVTHLLSTEAEVKGKTSKVVLAEGKNLPIVSEDFLAACKKAKKLIASKKYEIVIVGKAAKKAPAKKAPAKKAPAKKAPAKKALTKKAPAKKGGAKKKANAAIHPRVPSDYNDYELLVKDGVIYDAMLNQQEVSTNTDKFYVLQVLKNEDEDEWVVFQHWGRTGTSGQVKVDDEFEDEIDATSAFEDKFKSKTGSKWEDRQKFTKKKNKYNYLAKDYDLDRDTDVLWQYHLTNDPMGKPDGWYNYDGDASSDGTATSNMENYHEEFSSNSWLNIRFVNSGLHTYKVDFSQMEQTNTSSQKTRPIRRHHE